MNGNPQDFRQLIGELTDQAVITARDDYGVDLDFSPDSIPALYKLLQRAHILNSSPGYEKIFPSRTIQVWGAYLGETIRRERGGEWKENPAANYIRQYSVNTPTGNIFPMEQVYLRVVPGLQSTNLKVAIKEPPTTKVSSNSTLVLIIGILLILVLFISVGYFFSR